MSISSSGRDLRRDKSTAGGVDLTNIRAEDSQLQVEVMDGRFAQKSVRCRLMGGPEKVQDCDLRVAVRDQRQLDGADNTVSDSLEQRLEPRVEPLHETDKVGDAGMFGFFGRRDSVLGPCGHRFLAENGLVGPCCGHDDLGMGRSRHGYNDGVHFVMLDGFF